MTQSSSRRGARLRTAGIAAFVFAAGSILAGAGFAQDDRKPDAKADDKPALDPKDVRVGPPPELAALREAVEQAARKGENVDEIRKKLEALETALAGKPWVKPRPAREPQARDVPSPLVPRLEPRIPRQRLPQPELEQIQKAQAMILEAMMLQAAGDKEKAEKLLADARNMMLKGLAGGLGGLDGGLHGLPGMLDFGFPAPAAGKPRLGVQVDPVFEDLGKEFKVPADRGVRIVEVVPGSVADKAGFKPDDIVIEFAGKPVSNDAAAFVRTIREARAGQKFDFVVIRNGKKQTIEGVVLPPLARAADPLPLPVPLPGLNLDPALPLPGALRDLNGAFRNAFPAPPAEAGKAARVAVKLENGNFTIDATEDAVTVHIEGTVAGKPVPSRITVTDGDKKIEAESIDKLPAEYRDRVQKYLGNVKVVD